MTTGRKARSAGAIERDIAMAALADEEYVVQLFRRGLDTFLGLRDANGRVLRLACETRGKRSGYVRTKLPKGGRLDLLMVSRTVANTSGHIWITNRAGTSWVSAPQAASIYLAGRCGDNPEHVVRVAATIERARQHILRLVEETTRWL